ncbi:hypothetical protein HBA55_07205 [Pseudomaricurvus alkylphenolicus]|jgi:hypothetical protein|uniref:hypothetical protein n=1 Tax=Pseudomaricurvus alkylphenolicus TaxID=1306991 RepID=UPI001421B5F5|nr:hypothetical protein [Pseudomaricurvus alkylphenolicus]NIB39366.1 hypothetical protein [Pseudomaricurvus alkylphenolicus]
MDPMSAMFMVAGLILLIGSWLIMINVSFQTDYSWGLCALFVPPIAYLYGLFRWPLAGESILMSILGWVMLFLAWG